MQRLVGRGVRDPAEQQADAAADRAAGPTAAPPPPGGAPPPPPQPTDARRNLGSGVPLRSAERRAFETHIGAHLPPVRIHTGEDAAAAARDAAAAAFTVGRDVVVPTGYPPRTGRDSWVLTHELTHAVQQAGVAEHVQRIPMDAPPTWGAPAAPAQTNRQLIDAALQSESAADVKRIGNFGEATQTERIKLIGFLLNQWWVGPADERALERLWASFGDGLLTVANDNITLWDQSVERGAELTRLPPVATFIDTFGSRAVTQARQMLDTSEERINTERVRYGLSRHVEHEVDDFSAGGTTRARTTETFGMQASSTTKGLAAAAGQLAEKRREMSRLSAERSALERTVFNRQTGEEYTTISDRARHASLGRELEQKRLNYEALRATLEGQYPILATYADDAGISQLERIARGPSPDAAQVLETTTREKLDNIATVRRRLDDDAALIWKLEPVLRMTRAQMGIADTSIQAGMVRAKVDQVETNQSIIDLALSAIALTLGLLAAVPTGGSSLVAGAAAAAAVGGAGVSGYMAYEHARQYQFQAAASGTDFDKARAVSSEDPSLFWLAVDIIGVGFDLAGAVKAFRALSATARAAAAAHATEEAIEDLARLARSQGGNGAALAERVAASARSTRAARASEEVADAVRTVERAAEPMAEASVASGMLGRSSAGFGHHVTVSGGGIWRCSPVCQQLREAFARQLAENPDLERRLAALEGRASSAGSRETGEAIAREAAALEAALRAQVPHIPGSALRPGFNTSELVAGVAGAARRTPAEMEALLRMSGQLGEADLASLRRLVDEFAQGRQLTQAQSDEIGRLLEQVRTAPTPTSASARRAGRVRVDPFTGEPLTAGTEAHMRQRFFEYQQRNPEQFPNFTGEIDPRWRRQYETIIENARAGSQFEGEALGQLGMGKNNEVFINPDAEGAPGFIPDGIRSGPIPVEWGQPYHFVEVKGWQQMSNTGNLRAMIQYILDVPGSHIEVVFRSAAHPSGATQISGPLQRLLDALIADGRATVRWFPPVPPTAAAAAPTP